MDNKSRSSQRPMSSVSKPEVTKFITHNLQSEARLNMGFNEKGALMEYAKENIIAKLSLVNSCSPSASYRVEWEKPWPVGVKPYSSTYLLPDDRAVMRYRDTHPTCIFSAGMEFKQQYPGGYGFLQSILPDGRLVYIKETDPSRFRVSLYSPKGHECVMTLPTTFTAESISACCHPSSDWLALTDHYAQTLEIFHGNDHQLCIQLPYRPWPINGVVALHGKGGYSWIAVAHGSDLHFFNWLGEEVGKVGEEELELKGEGGIKGMGASEDGTLQIATGGYMNVKALHVYSVE